MIKFPINWVSHGIGASISGHRCTPKNVTTVVPLAGVLKELSAVVKFFSPDVVEGVPDVVKVCAASKELSAVVKFFSPDVVERAAASNGFSPDVVEGTSDVVGATHARL